MIIPTRGDVAMDRAHANLIGALVRAEKPHDILEIGIGAGTSTRQIVRAIDFNKRGKLTIVDNWLDWDGQEPPEVRAWFPKAQIITQDEGAYIASLTTTQFDFMLLDGDHENSDKWFRDVYARILRPGGTLIYHDINMFEHAYVNLRKIYEDCQRRGLPHRLFNKSSREDERCGRGLLVIWKPA